MRPRPRRHALAAVGRGNGFVFANIRIKYGHCLFIRQFEDIYIQMKHLRRRFPTVWAARHCSPGRTMMQNGPHHDAKRAVRRCRTGHIAVPNGPYRSAKRAVLQRMAWAGPRRGGTGGVMAVDMVLGVLAVAAGRGLWPRYPLARCPAHNVWVFCCPGAWGVTALK